MMIGKYDAKNTFLDGHANYIYDIRGKFVTEVGFM